MQTMRLMRSIVKLLIEKNPRSTRNKARTKSATISKALLPTPANKIAIKEKMKLVKITIKLPVLVDILKSELALRLSNKESKKARIIYTPVN